ncbi:hypothetical protein E8F20_01340 [Pseudomonas sp. BN415]|uniref:YhfG family protein n=1 Tax=Pseudomonas sp. BN415 TaxID=2567889 RepID=UPI002456E674|nr:YhfG family protein [Pseudomonas sp. BN415]MDH4580515.1 hypothetical protein [Pseudomonas sp. BN415]
MPTLSLQAKMAYYAKARQSNYAASLRLESFDTTPADAEHFGDLNMIHPFRDGIGRAQRILFEHLIVNVGYEISWWPAEEAEWLRASVDTVVFDYSALIRIFDRCIGPPIA